jgi:hypothetical protein
MKQLNILILCAAIVPAMALAATPPTTLDTTTNPCSTITWNPAFLADFPKAPAACREITVKDGVKFAKFDGTVTKVGTQFVQVAVSDVANLPISTIAFQIGTGGRITMGDKVIKVADLQAGDALTFWVREGKYGVSPTLTDEPMAIVKPDAMTTR